MMHFGVGGLMDYLLSEVTWLRDIRADSFVGRNNGFDPHKHWVTIRETYKTTNLRRNLVIR